MLSNAPAQAAQPALLLILGETGSEQALPVLRSHLQDSSNDNQDAAVLALSQWPNSQVLDDLLGIVERATSPARTELALKGFMRLADAASDPKSNSHACSKRVTQVGDRKRVLAALDAHAASPGAMELATDYLNDKELGPTAGLAAVHIANRLRDSHSELAHKTLRQVIQAVDNPDVRKRAQWCSTRWTSLRVTSWLGGRGPLRRKREGWRGGLYDGL